MKIFQITLSAVFLLTLNLCPQAQQLFSYNSTPVSKDEFVKAFFKNNTNEKPTEKDYRDYLELFIRYKLKVKAAYELRLDTLPNQKAELNDFKSQIAENYLVDDSSFKMLVDEAFTRSQKDIHLLHIYIPFQAGSLQPDTAKAWKLAMDAYNELQRGSEFGNVASLYSADSSVRVNKGDIGFITVFTLPYELENLAYQTPVGKFSLPYRGKSGYHIFKNMGERKAAGRMKAAQILLAWPPDSNDSVKATFRKTADSIYTALQQGASFDQLAYTFRNDNEAAGNNGILPEFGVGGTEPAFENAAFSLEKNGDFTKPLASRYGYHILLQKERMPVSPDASDPSTLEMLRQHVKEDARMARSREAMAHKIEKVTGIKKGPVNEKELLIFADSALQGKKLPKLPGISEKSVLYSFPGKQVFASDLVNYLQNVKNIPALSAKPLPELLKQFKTTVATDYYRAHLEGYNPAFALQVKEFKEGNLLFEIMQRKIWDKAAADSSGLKAYFDRNKNKYWWEPSADAVIFSCTDSTVAAELIRVLKGSPKEWKKIIAGFGDKAQADSGRFELSQIIVPGQTRLTEGAITPPVKAVPDERTTFAFIIKIYPEKLARNFDAAKGFVLNDYQNYLEDNWIKELKKKYSVKVNEDVFGSLLR